MLARLLNHLSAVLGLAFLGCALCPSFAFAGVAPTAEQCAQTWIQVKRSDTIVGYQNFLSYFSSCRAEAALARQALAALTDQDPSRGASHAQTVTKTYRPIGRFLKSGAAFSSENGGYGVVILNRLGERNEQACISFSKALPFVDEAKPLKPEFIDGSWVYRRPVYWLTTQAEGPAPIQRCQEMLASYDFDRADVWRQRLNLKGSGPFIVLMRSDEARAGIYDFSKMPEDEFARVFEESLNKLTQESDAWDQSLYREASLRQRLRRALREDNAQTNNVIAIFLNLPTNANAAPY